MRFDDDIVMRIRLCREYRNEGFVERVSEDIGWSHDAETTSHAFCLGVHLASAVERLLGRHSFREAIKGFMQMADESMEEFDDDDAPAEPTDLGDDSAW